MYAIFQVKGQDAKSNVSLYLQKKTGRICKEIASTKGDEGFEVRGDKNGGQT